MTMKELEARDIRHALGKSSRARPRGARAPLLASKGQQIVHQEATSEIHLLTSEDTEIKSVVSIDCPTAGHLYDIRFGGGMCETKEETGQRIEESDGPVGDTKKPAPL